VDVDEVDGVRALLDAFVEDVFGSLARKDQRAKGGLYLQGLMLEGRRKSMQPMGGRLGIDYQQLQQFVSSSPWPVEPVRRALVRHATQVIRPEAWVIDDTGFKKDGPASPGVARQYSGTLGKVGNVQIGVSLHAASDAASCPLDWRLYLPEAWDDTFADTNEEAEQIVERRRRAGIPDAVRHRTKWEQSIEMIDELASWGYRPPVVVADAGYGEVAGFRTALTERGMDYVVAVKAATSVYPADTPFGVAGYVGRGRPPVAGYAADPVQTRRLAADLGRDAFRELPWRNGTRTRPDNAGAVMSSRFAAVRVRPANRTIPRNPDGTLPDCWLILEWPDGASEPTDQWLSTLPMDTSITELVRLAKIRWRIEHDYRELKHGLGLDHFEGRTWAGWHHHTTLVTAAHLFITSLRLTADPKAHGAA
jgi:SRSO17 transposase